VTGMALGMEPERRSRRTELRNVCVCVCVGNCIDDEYRPIERIAEDAATSS
jgi:hypothetical protein